MAQPLMPKATAVWLVENTTLTFEQIATFCGLHKLEVQAIADGEVAIGMVGLDPVAGGQLTHAEIERAQADPTVVLSMARRDDLPPALKRTKGPRYTPVTKRADKPDGIAWLLKNTPELTEAQIVKLIGTTKTTIAAVKNRTHENSANIKPRNPVQLGLATQGDMDDMLAKARISRPQLAEAAAAAREEARLAELAYTTEVEPD